MSFGKYSKFWVALGTVVLAGLVHVYGNSNEWVQLVIGLLGALGVHQVSNA